MSSFKRFWNSFTDSFTCMFPSIEEIGEFTAIMCGLAVYFVIPALFIVVAVIAALLLEPM